MSSGITRDDWLKALEAAGVDDRDDPDAITAGELAVMLGIGHQAAVRRLKKLEAMGQATKTRKRAAGADGRMMSLPAYRLVDAPKKKRR